MPKSYYTTELKLAKAPRIDGHGIFSTYNGKATFVLAKGRQHDLCWQTDDNHKAGVREIPELNAWQIWELEKVNGVIQGTVQYEADDKGFGTHCITATDEPDFHCQANAHALSLLLAQEGIPA